MIKFKCPECSYGCNTAAGLRRHRGDVHRGTRRFSCPVCSKVKVAALQRD